MNDNNTNSYNSIEDDSIDIIQLVQLVKTVWVDRNLVFKIACISFVIGCIVALISPVIYISETTFVPQTSDHQGKSLGSLAALAGINLMAETSSSLDNYISPLLYSKIIESEEFSLNLII